MKRPFSMIGPLFPPMPTIPIRGVVMTTPLLFGLPVASSAMPEIRHVRTGSSIIVTPAAVCPGAIEIC